MAKITVRNTDGFGSQMLSIISGIAFAKAGKDIYFHTPLSGIKLVGDENLKNDELEKINIFLENFTKNLGIKSSAGHHCDEKHHLHSEILTNGKKYYNKDFTNFLNSGFPLDYPVYYNKLEHNIAIHIRRGLDIKDYDMPHRFIDPDIYEKLINKIKMLYPNSKIHIFSWGDSLIKEDKNIVFHVCTNPSFVLEDFSGLVMSDILFVGSSTFSMSAGLINKNKVVISNEFYKLGQMYVPEFWYENYKEFE